MSCICEIMNRTNIKANYIIKIVILVIITDLLVILGSAYDVYVDDYGAHIEMVDCNDAITLLKHVRNGALFETIRDLERSSGISLKRSDSSISKETRLHVLFYLMGDEFFYEIFRMEPTGHSNPVDIDTESMIPPEMNYVPDELINTWCWGYEYDVCPGGMCPKVCSETPSSIAEDIFDTIQQIKDYSIIPGLGEIAAEIFSMVLGLDYEPPWPLNTFAWKIFSHVGTAFDVGEYISGQTQTMYFHSFYKDGFDAGYDIGWKEGEADRLSGNEYAPRGLNQEYLINKPEVRLRFLGKQDGYQKGYRDGYYWQEGLSIALQVTPNEISGSKMENIIVRPIVKYNGKLISDYECEVTGQTDVGSFYPEKSTLKNSFFGGKYASFEYNPPYGTSGGGSYTYRSGFINFYAKLRVNGEEKDVSAIVPITNEEKELTSTVYTGGNVQVTLTWNSHADIDLYVEDPNQEVVWYKNPTVSSGGQLDRDNRCEDFTMGDPENIYWPASGAPSGEYKISVDYYQDCGNVGPVTWNVRKIAGGKIENYNGILQEVADHQEVAAFEIAVTAPSISVDESYSTSTPPIISSDSAISTRTVDSDTKTAYTRDGIHFITKERMEQNIKAGLANPGDYYEAQVPLDTVVIEASMISDET